MNICKRAYVDVSLDAIYKNVKTLQSRLNPGTKTMAVIKANAYGHGDVPVARTLHDCVDAYAVATQPEAVNLRMNGIDKPVLILSFINCEEYQEAIEKDIDITIFDMETAAELSAVAEKIGKTANCHIKIDTGMHRIGFKACDESVDDIEKISKLPFVNVRGIFTHFYQSDSKDKSKAEEQFAIFDDFVKKCRDKGVGFEVVHCSNSAASMDIPAFNMDMVRMGISIYGLDPSEEMKAREYGLEPALSVKSQVIMLKEIGIGESVGYGATFTADRETKVATVSIGYADGIPRTLSNRAHVLVNGKRAKIIGRICMDQLMIDCTDIPSVKRGDTVTIIGNDGDESITVEEDAAISGRFNYEFVCDLAKRLPRNYYKDNRFIGQKVWAYDEWNF